MSSVFRPQTTRFCFRATNPDEASGAKIDQKRHSCGGHLTRGFFGLVAVAALIADLSDHI
jgi:hypothetical protein